MHRMDSNGRPQSPRPSRRVVLSRMPQILRDILEHEILQQPDLQLLDDDDGSNAIGAAPDVVVVAAAAGDRRFASLSLLREWPSARVIVVTPHEGQVAVYRLEPQMTDLGRVSPAELIQLIRSGPLPPEARTSSRRPSQR